MGDNKSEIVENLLVIPNFILFLFPIHVLSGVFTLVHLKQGLCSLDGKFNSSSYLTIAGFSFFKKIKRLGVTKDNAN